MTATDLAHSDRAHPTRSLAILGVSALAYALAQTTVIPAVGTLATDLHTTTSNATWTLTAYLVAAAVLTPIFGRLGDMFGKRRMLVISLLLFAAGSAVSALGTGISIVVLGRVIQGAGGGIFPLCYGIIRDEFPRERVGRSIGLLAATAGIGGGLGLPLGGWILDNMSYHYIFWVGAVMALVAAAAAHFLVPESLVRTPGKVDVRGAFVLAVGLSAPLIAISEAGDWGWGSAKFIGLTVIGLLVLFGFFYLEARTPSPIVNVHTLRRPPVLLTNITTLLVGFGMFAIFLLVPVIAQAPKSSGYGFEVDATRAGLLLAPGAIFMLVAGPLSGIIGNRFGNKVPLALGSFVAALGLALMALDHDSQLAIVVLGIVIFGGVGMAFAAMPNLIVDAVAPTETSEATGVNALIRSVGSSLGSQVVASVLAASLIAGSVLPTDDAITASFYASAGVALLAGLMALVIPKPTTHHKPDLGDELGAASVLGEPAVPRADVMTLADVDTAGRRSDAQRNHERIIAAAIEVFAEQGLDASIPDVAARAGVGKATVYRNYPTKEDLVAAVTNERLEWLANRSAEAAGEDDAWAALLAYVQDIATHVMVDRALCEVLRNDRRPGAIALRERKTASTAELLAKGQVQGTIRPDVTADDLRILLGGLSTQLHSEGERDPAVWSRYAVLLVESFRATRD